MKKLFSLIFSIVLFGNEININNTIEKDGLIYKKNGSTPFTGVILSYYNEENIHEKTSYKSGEKNGPYYKYTDEGQIIVEGNFKCNMKNGKFVSYYPNRQPKIKADYINDLIISNYAEFYSDGFIKEISVRDIENDNQLISRTILYDEKSHAQTSIIYFTIKSNSYRIDTTSSTEKKYITSGKYSGNRISSIIFYLNNTFDSDNFMFIQDYLFLLVVPFFIIVFSTNFYRKKCINKFLGDHYFINDYLNFNIFTQFHLQIYNFIEIETNEKKERFSINKAIKNKYIDDIIRRINHFYLSKTNNSKNKQIREYSQKNFSSTNINDSIKNCKYMNTSLIINGINSLHPKLTIFLSIIYPIALILMFYSFDFFILLIMTSLCIIIFLIFPIFKLVNHNHSLNNAYRDFFNAIIFEKTNLYFVLSKFLLYKNIPFTGVIRLISDKNFDYETILSYKHGLLDGEQVIACNKDNIVFISYYKNGKNIGPFYCYTKDKKIQTYSITKNKDDFSIKINNYCFTENEIISYITSNKMNINNSNNKVSLSKDKTNAFKSIQHKFKTDFSNIFIPENFLNVNYSDLKILIIVAGILIGLSFFHFQNIYFTKMPSATLDCFYK